MSVADRDSINPSLSRHKEAVPNRDADNRRRHTRSPGGPESPVPGKGKAGGPTAGADDARTLTLSTATPEATRPLSPTSTSKIASQARV